MKDDNKYKARAKPRLPRKYVNKIILEEKEENGWEKVKKILQRIDWETLSLKLKKEESYDYTKSHRKKRGVSTLHSKS